MVENRRGREHGYNCDLFSRIEKDEWDWKGCDVGLQCMVWRLVPPLASIRPFSFFSSSSSRFQFLKWLSYI
jgi:hypothetical protein